MDTIRQDVRYALRMLWKHRFATFVCAGALALGIGANTAIFSMAEGFLLHPVPLEDVNRVVAMVDSQPQRVENSPIAPQLISNGNRRLIPLSRWELTRGTGSISPATPRRKKFRIFWLPPIFSRCLGVQPQLGRDFLAEEGQPGRNQELILSHGLWERRYASDPKILGKAVKVNGKPFTIVGVMAKGFDYPMSAEAWLPMAFDAKATRRP